MSPDRDSPSESPDPAEPNEGRSTGAASALTEGDLAGPLLALAWPMVAIQLLQVAYNIADTVFLGALSADAVGAVGLAFPAIFLVLSLGGGFTAAGAILVAQHTGAGGDRRAGHVAGQTLWFVTAVAVVLGVAGFFGAGPLLSLLPADDATATQVLPLAAQYMRVFFLGVPVLFGFFVFVSLMRGYGDTRTPLRVMLVSVLVNVALDPVFIFGLGPVPAMGIEGAAVATVLARVVGLAIGLYVLFGTDAGPAVSLSDLRPDFGVVRDILRLGVPSALEQSGSATAMVVVTAMVVTFPPAVVAAYGLGDRVVSLVFLPAMGAGQAVNTAVGQNLGAGKPERAARAVRLAGTAVAVAMLAATVVVALVPGAIAGVFLSADAPGVAATIGHATAFLRTVALMFVFMGVLQVVLGTFRGAGNTGTALAFSLVTLWVVRVPVTYWLAFEAGWGPQGIWTGFAAGDVVGCLAAVAWFLRGTWKSAVVGGDDGGSPETAPGASVDGD